MERRHHDAKNPTWWLERILHSLDNGDMVAAVTPWTPPNETLKEDQIADLLEKVMEGDGAQIWSKRPGHDDCLISRAMEELGIATGDGRRNAFKAIVTGGFRE